MATKKEKPDKILAFIEYVKARKYIFGTIILVIGLLAFGGVFAYQKYEATKMEKAPKNSVNEQTIVRLLNLERVNKNHKSLQLESDLSLLALKTLEKAVNDGIKTKPALEYAKTIAPSDKYKRYIPSDILSNELANGIINKLCNSEGFADNVYDSIGVAVDGQGRVVVVLGQSITLQSDTIPAKTTTPAPIKAPTTVPTKTPTPTIKTCNEGAKQTAIDKENTAYQGALNACQGLYDEQVAAANQASWTCQSGSPDAFQSVCSATPALNRAKATYDNNVASTNATHTTRITTINATCY